MTTIEMVKINRILLETIKINPKCKKCLLYNDGKCFFSFECLSSQQSDFRNKGNEICYYYKVEMEVPLPDTRQIRYFECLKEMTEQEISQMSEEIIIDLFNTYREKFPRNMTEETRDIYISHCYVDIKKIIKEEYDRER